MKKILAVLIVLVMISSTAVYAASDSAVNKASTKLSRGVTNLATCWGEYITQLPASYNKTPDYLTGTVYGLFRGTAFMIRRAGVGVFDVVTCPFAGTTNYGPIMKPETIFTKTVDYLSD